MNWQLYRTSTTYGLVADVPPSSPASRLLLNILEPIFERCHMCGDQAVRVGVFETETRRDKPASEFRALCERHKQFGMWSNAETAWGWD